MEEQVTEGNEEEEKSHLFAVRTTVGKENTVLDFVINRIKKEKIGIRSVVIAPGLKGYLIIETNSLEEAQRAITGLTYVTGMLNGEMTLEEIAPYLESKTTKEIPERALVEITNGPFKGEKAKVTRVNKTKEEVIVELIEATVSIPITLKWDAIRVLEKDVSVLNEKDIEGSR